MKVNLKLNFEELVDKNKALVERYNKVWKKEFTKKESIVSLLEETELIICNIEESKSYNDVYLLKMFIEVCEYMMDCYMNEVE